MVQILPMGVLGSIGGMVFGGEAHDLDFLPIFPKVNRLRWLFEKLLRQEIQPLAITLFAPGTVTGLGGGEVSLWIPTFRKGLLPLQKVYPKAVGAS